MLKSTEFMVGRNPPRRPPNPLGYPFCSSQYRYSTLVAIALLLLTLLLWNCCCCCFRQSWPPLKPFTAVASGTVATTAVCSVLVLVGFEKARRFDIHLIIDLSRVDELCLRMTGRGLSDPLLPRCPLSAVPFRCGSWCCCAATANPIAAVSDAATHPAPLVLNVWALSMELEQCF